MYVVVVGHFQEACHGCLKLYGKARRPLARREIFTTSFGFSLRPAGVVEQRAVVLGCGKKAR
jgi:hypothetical protein